MNTSDFPMSRRAKRAVVESAGNAPMPLGSRHIALGAETLGAATEASAEIARFDGRVGPRGVNRLMRLVEAVVSTHLGGVVPKAASVAAGALGEKTRSAGAGMASLLHEAISAGVGGMPAGDEGARIYATALGSTVSANDPLVADLEVFIERTDVAPLVQLALVHSQWQALEGGPDNPMGRLLVARLVPELGLATESFLPISLGLAAHRNELNEANAPYLRGDVDAAVDAFVAATFVSIGHARVLVDEVCELQAAWQERLTVRRDAAARSVLTELVNQPVVTINHVAATAGVTFHAARTAVGQLEEAGVLRLLTDQARNRSWVAHEVSTRVDRLVQTVLT